MADQQTPPTVESIQRETTQLAHEIQRHTKARQQILNQLHQNKAALQQCSERSAQLSQQLQSLLNAQIQQALLPVQEEAVVLARATAQAVNPPTPQSLQRKRPASAISDSAQQAEVQAQEPVKRNKVSPLMSARELSIEDKENLEDLFLLSETDGGFSDGHRRWSWFAAIFLTGKPGGTLGMQNTYTPLSDSEHIGVYAGQLMTRVCPGPANVRLACRKTTTKGFELMLISPSGARVSRDAVVLINSWDETVKRAILDYNLNEKSRNRESNDRMLLSVARARLYFWLHDPRGHRHLALPENLPGYDYTSVKLQKPMIMIQTPDGIKAVDTDSDDQT